MSGVALPDPALPHGPALRRLAAELALGAAYWAVFLLTLEPGNVMRATAMGNSLPPSLEAIRMATASLLGAVSAPAALALTRRFPIGRAKLWRNGAVLAAGVAALTVGLIVASCLLAGLGGLDGSTDVPGELALNGPLVAFCLAGFVVLAHVLHFRRRENRNAGEVSASPPARPFLRQIPVKTRGGLVVVALDEVDWIEAQGNYLALHVGSAVHLIRETSARLEQRLDPQRFARAHRGTLVALDRIRELRPLGGGDAEIRLADGAWLRLSRSYRGLIQGRLERAQRRDQGLS